MREIQVEQSSRETGTQQQGTHAASRPPADPLRRRRDSEKNAPSRWSEWGVDWFWMAGCDDDGGREKKRREVEEEEEEEDKEKQRE